MNKTLPDWGRKPDATTDENRIPAIDTSKLPSSPPAWANFSEPGPQDGLIPTWSFSTLDKAETCMYSVYLSKVEKAPRVESPAAERGTMLHDLAEQYTRGNLDELPKELRKHYERAFSDLRDLYSQGLVTCEEDWGYTAEWEPTGFFDDDTWARMKLDVLVMENETSARVIDHKSGRPYPMKHNQQGQLYTIGTFLRYPKLEFVQTEFWYIDKSPQPATNKYTREQAMMFLPKWTQRALRLTKAKTFEPNPSASNCKFCDHNKSGYCDYRVG